MRDSHAALVAALLLAACGGGGGGNAGPSPAPLPVALTAPDVERIVAQAAAEAQARAKPAHIVVVDRVGNVLASYHMTGAPDTVSIVSPFNSRGGLEGIAPGTIPAPLAAIAKAITGAYLSSNGNAFSTRTAGQIIEEHFDPQEAHQPGGPLYGVQFSQLTCSDVVRNQPTHGTIGPKRSPLGLAADPGGLPLYKDGSLVGAIGAEADGIYTIDRDITDVDDAVEEHIAVAGSFGFAAPADIRGDRITADGRTFRFIDSEATMSDPSKAPPLASIAGALTAIAGYQPGAAIAAGTPFGSAASGLRPGDGGWILVDGANANRYAPRASPDGSISAADVQSLLAKAIAIAQRARGQIRRPLGSSAEVSIAVVDLNGDILGFIRTPDAPVFGVDVAVQKARTALFFSHPLAASDLAAFPAVARYGPAFQSFLGTPASLTGGIAWTPRAIGNLHRPYFPDGIEGTAPGPLSTPFATWSPFNVGFQLDLVYDQLVKGAQGDLSEGCAGSIRRLRNGAQVFPGGVPIYSGANLVAAIGVSGDGVDQDDMVALLAVANWASPGRGNAPRAMRSDTLTPQGVRLRYAQCPQAPFNDSSDQNVCAGL
jgi:uncharacterized protein GlcG (DUF336 family)